VYSGIYKDGWLQKVVRVRLAGGRPAALTIRAEVIIRKGQHLDVVVNGRTVAAVDVPPGLLNLHVPIGPSPTARAVELQWGTAGHISASDSREAAALMKSISIDAVRPPGSLRTASFSDLNVASSGIYRDGWLQQDARVLLAGGPSSELEVRAEVIAAGGRHLDVAVNGHTAMGFDAAPGLLELRIPIGPSPSARMIELRWSSTSRISANDPREAAALLERIGITSVQAPTSVRRADLVKPQLAYAGIYEDGWLLPTARVLLAGGPATKLTLRADVTTKSAQHLDIFVNGVHVLSGATTGRLDLTAPLRASGGPRLVVLQWSTASPIGPADKRLASARLTLISVGR
jgi:hypothetical protein